MSILNKKPYAQQVVESLGQEELQSLAIAINGGGQKIFRSYLNLSAPFTSDDKGAKHCVFEAQDAIFTGYLCYNDYYCVLFTYTDTKNQEMKIIKIDYVNDKYEFVDEELSINEFRQIVKNADFKKVIIENITELSDDVCNALKCGDVLLKEDNTGYHAYIVSYKKDNTGMCITYADASVVETVSYDYIESHWVYNSTDKGTI